jgi:hypothetical protein
MKKGESLLIWMCYINVLSEELEDERKQHIKDLADRDFTADQTRKKYQG